MISVETVTKISVRESNVVSILHDWYCAGGDAENEVERMVSQTSNVEKVERFTREDLKRDDSSGRYDCEIMVKVCLKGNGNYDIYTIY